MEGPFRSQLFINNEFVNSASGDTFPVINPATEQVICHVQSAQAADVDKAVSAAKSALEEGAWGKMDGHQRGRLMHRLAALIEEHQEELARLESLVGKPLRDTLNEDLPGVLECLRYFAGWADKIVGKQIPVPGSFFSYTRHEPVGVVAAIIPWNYPLMMAAWKLGPALACGNTVVLKPAEQSPLSALRLAELIVEAGFPSGVVNVLTGYGETAGHALTHHMDVNKVAFTGSCEVGRLIMAAAADSNLKRVTLELGGKSANVVFEDADIDLAVEGAVGAIFANMGQNCVAGSRLFLHESIHDDFLNKLVSKVEKELTVGNPFEMSTNQGPLVDNVQFQRVLQFIESGKSEGATVSTGGKRRGSNGFYVEPTIFSNVVDSMRIAREEIFGPVLCVLKFSSFDEVLDRVNSTSYGLGAAVWTRDINKANAFVRKAKAGTVWINTYNINTSFVPFGGFKQSGFGRDLGEYALQSYTEVKAVTMAV
eukprot:GILJ01006411.1.p1 GENE.GILJ01006411.1~~GILJ01006411.1.p1  ORF type:complete len:482 (+),score=93.47 GILJ01006411.1:272-1717(+)